MMGRSVFDVFFGGACVINLQNIKKGEKKKETMADLHYYPAGVSKEAYMREVRRRMIEYGLESAAEYIRARLHEWIAASFTQVDLSGNRVCQLEDLEVMDYPCLSDAGIGRIHTPAGRRMIVRYEPIKRIRKKGT